MLRRWSLIHFQSSLVSFIGTPTYQFLCEHGPIPIGEVGFHGEHDTVGGDGGENDVFEWLTSSGYMTMSNWHCKSLTSTY